MSFSDAFETVALQWAFTSAAVTRPSAWYLAIFTAAPGEAGGGTEVSGTGTAYVRKPATFTVSGNSATTSANVEWDVATADWGTITAVAVFDAASGGTMISYASLATPRAIGTGDVFRVPAGDLNFTLN